MRNRIAPGRSLIVTVLIASALWAATPAAAQSTISIEEYVGRLDLAIQRAGSGASAPSTAAMDEVRSTLGLPVTVQTASGTTLIESDPYLASLAGTSERDFESVGRHLVAVRTAAVASGTLGPIPSADEIQDGLAEAAKVDPAGRRAEVQELPWLSRFLAWLFGKTRGAGTVLDVILRILVWAIALGFLAGMVYLIWRLRPRVVPDTDRGEHDGESIGNARQDRRRDVHAAIAEGRMLDAVHLSYHLMIRTLTRRGFVPRIPGLTAGEARSAVSKARPGIAAPISDATHRFERIVYGGDHASEPDVQVILDAEKMAARS